jgi:hypothetical protein
LVSWTANLFISIFLEKLRNGLPLHEMSLLKALKEMPLSVSIFLASSIPFFAATTHTLVSNVSLEAANFTVEALTLSENTAVAISNVDINVFIIILYT